MVVFASFTFGQMHTLINDNIIKYAYSRTGASYTLRYKWQCSDRPTLCQRTCNGRVLQRTKQACYLAIESIIKCRSQTSIGQSEPMSVAIVSGLHRPIRASDLCPLIRAHFCEQLYALCVLSRDFTHLCWFMTRAIEHLRYSFRSKSASSQRIY